MDRMEAERIIATLYGAPGEEHDTLPGRVLVNELLNALGLAALTDEAVVALARRNQEHEEDQVRQALRRG